MERKRIPWLVTEYHHLSIQGTTSKVQPFTPLMQRPTSVHRSQQSLTMRIGQTYVLYFGDDLLGGLGSILRRVVSGCSGHGRSCLFTSLLKLHNTIASALVADIKGSPCYLFSERQRVKTCARYGRWATRRVCE